MIWKKRDNSNIKNCVYLDFLYDHENVFKHRDSLIKKKKFSNLYYRLFDMTVQSFLGNYCDVFTVAGVVSVSYFAFRLALSVFNGIKVFLLARSLGLSKNLKKCGQWAGMLLTNE